MSTCVFFFFNDTATTEIYTLSLHDALPICAAATDSRRAGHGRRLLGNRPLSQSRSARTEPQRGRGAGGVARAPAVVHPRSEEHTSGLQSQANLGCRRLLGKKHRSTTYGSTT